MAPLYHWPAPLKRVLAGNSSTQEGGAVFNSRHTGSGDVAPDMHMHNCLIAGNVADGTGDLGMGGVATVATVTRLPAYHSAIG